MNKTDFVTSECAFFLVVTDGEKNHEWGSEHSSLQPFVFTPIQLLKPGGAASGAAGDAGGVSRDRDS